MEWIAFTMLAAFMQSVRTAGQKHMTTSMSAVVATWARYGFGLPVAIVYFVIVTIYEPQSLPAPTLAFTGYVTIAAVGQLMATLMLVKLLSFRNFAVGTTYAKTEGLLAAVLAAMFFGRAFSTWTWVAIFVGVTGIIFVSVQKNQDAARWSAIPALLGLGAGIGFAITAVFVREANLVLEAPLTISAAYILLLSIFIQGSLCTVLLHRQSKHNWRVLRNNAKAGWFVGITGTVGSIGWYSAFALQEAAIVKTLGQVEFLFTVLITYAFFKEKITRAEWIGMALVLISVLILFGPGQV